MDAAGKPGGIAGRGSRICVDRRAGARRPARAAGGRQRAGRQRGATLRHGAGDRARPCRRQGAGTTDAAPSVLPARSAGDPRRPRQCRGRHRRGAYLARSRRGGFRGGARVRHRPAQLCRFARRVSRRHPGRRRRRAGQHAHLEGQRRHRRRAAPTRRAAGLRQDRAQLPELLAAQDAGDLPHHAAVVHLDGAGEPAQDRAGLDQGRALGAGLGRGAHRRHGGRPAGLVHLAPAHLGRADRAVRAQGHPGAAPRFRRAARTGGQDRGAGRCRCVVRARSGHAAGRSGERLREGHRRARRVVRFRRHAFRRDRPATGTAARQRGRVQGDVSGRLRPAPRLVPVLTADLVGDPRPRAV